MDTNRKIVKALLMKDYAALKEGVFSTLYTKASLALNEARRGVAEAVFNEAAKTSGVPGKVVEMAMTDARLKELVKKRRITAKKNQSYSTAADDRIRNRMEREAGSKRVYGRGGKVLKRKPKGKTHGFGSPAFERGQGWMGMQGY